MASKGSIMVVAIAAALTLFVVLAVAPFITGNEDNYNLHGNGIDSSVVTVDEAVIVTEEIPETDVNTDTVVDEAVVSEAVVEQEEIAQQVEETTQEVVEEAAPVEQALVEEVEQAQTQLEQVVETVEAEVVEQAESMAPVSGEGQVHVVTAQGLKFEPLVINIQVGDTVAWENMSSHDTQSMEGLIPAGAEPWHSGMGENFQHTFTVEGIYVYKCTPHFGAGMGGAVIVGNPVNLAEIKATKVKGAGKRLVKKAIAVAEKM